MKLLVLLCLASLAAGSDDEKRLQEYLLSNYNPDIRPVAKYSDGVPLDISISLIDFKISKEHNKIKAQTWIYMFWEDANLKWDPAEYGNIEAVRLDVEKLWRPDMTLYNGYEFDDKVLIPTKAVAYNNGSVIWVPPAFLKSRCERTDETSMTCSWKIGSWVYDGNMILMTADASTVNTKDLNPNVEWEVAETSFEKVTRYYDCCKEPYDHVAATVKFTKKEDVPERDPEVQALEKIVTLLEESLASSEESSSEEEEEEGQ